MPPLRLWTCSRARPQLSMPLRIALRGFITVYRENIRLAEENERLLGWQQVALRLSAENAELRDLAKLVPEPAISFVTARVIADSGGAYARSVMVNAGRDNGVARGQAAMTGEGLVGRVAEVGSRAARILLITDLNSRVPVVVEGTAPAGDPRRRQLRSAEPALRGRGRNDTDRRQDRHLGPRRRLSAGASGGCRRQRRQRRSSGRALCGVIAGRLPPARRLWSRRSPAQSAVYLRARRQARGIRGRRPADAATLSGARRAAASLRAPGQEA